MNLKLNTVYKPLTYDELIKPLVDYGKAYKEVEDAYSTLAEQAEAFKDEANQTLSSEAYNLYNGYSADLNAAIEDFSRGMTVANRSKLLEMKRRYAGEIKPIAKASEALKEANAFRDKAGPDAIFKVNRYTSLDDFLHGQIADNTYTSAKQLAAQANAEALTAGSKLYRERYSRGDTPITDTLYKKLWNEVGGNSYDTEGKEKLHNAIMIGINSAMYSMEQQDKERELQLASLNETKRAHNMNAQFRGYKVDNKGNLITDKNGNLVIYPNALVTKSPTITNMVSGNYKITEDKIEPIESLEGMSFDVISYNDAPAKSKLAIARLIGDSAPDNYTFYKDDQGLIYMNAKTPKRMGTDAYTYEEYFDENG